MPVFETRVHKKDKITRKPVLEILKDGKPFWEDFPWAKKHFRFGVEKALTLMTAFPVIEEFYNHDGREPNTPDPIKLKSSRYCPMCRIRRYNGFTRKGRFINRPYLEITGYDTIRFGLLKAIAIIENREVIEDFIFKFG